jgi:hypothetical protein
MEKHKVWKRRISEWRSSGESIAAYCRRENLSTSSFEYWRKQLESLRFVRVGEPIRIELMLQDGTMLRIPADVATLRTVLEALNAPTRG